MSREAGKLRPEEARMVHGRRKETNPLRIQGHIKTDVENNFIWKVETTAANVHDSQVDLANEGEVRYGDKGYHGAKTKGYDASMKKAARGIHLAF